MARVVGDAGRMTIADWKASLLTGLRLKGHTFIQVDLFLGKNKLDDNRHLVYYNVTNASCVEVVPTARATGDPGASRVEVVPTAEATDDLGDPQAGCFSLVGKHIGEWLQARCS